MIPLLSREAMQAFDGRAIARGVPGAILMENAGRAATDVLLSRRPDARRVLVVCGAGNNGGDGYVVARHLHARGRDVEVVALAAPESLTGDAKGAHAAWRAVGGATRPDLPEVLEHDVVVDAIFGTGLSRRVEGPLAVAIARLDRARWVGALDLPSGLDATTGRLFADAPRAALTVTFGHWKAGLATPLGKEHAGEVVRVDLGVPADDGELTPRAHLCEEDDLARLLAPRPQATHKHREGRVVVVGGSPGMTGALLLAGDGAARAGAGLVTLATWGECADGVEARVREAMTARIDRADVMGSIQALLGRARVVVVGPGLGTDADARTLARHVALRHEGPVVLDADALFHVAENPAALAAVRHPRVLLPHEGELARLLGVTSRDIGDDRFGRAREAARLTGATVVLKGPFTVVAQGDELVAVDAGGPAMATGGSGDVLAGVVGALLLGASPKDAALLGVHLHGRAGEAWSRDHGDRGLLAGELAAHVPDVMRALLTRRAQLESR